jgi:16S rRNA (adenine1518-N6/adenine1519-N6)-dimethyltransferase
VVAVELDQHLLPPLKAILTSNSNVRLIYGDILELSPAELVKAQDYIVVANIPYYITSAVIRHLLESSTKPRRIVLTVQKEVAKRICEKPGNMSLLALSVQVYGQPHIVPSPNVDSAVLVIEIYPMPLIPHELLEPFFKLIKAGFSQKRKTLRNSLSAGLSISTESATELLNGAGINPMRRAETLSIEEWQRLSEKI